MSGRPCHNSPKPSNCCCYPCLLPGLAAALTTLFVHGYKGVQISEKDREVWARAGAGVKWERPAREKWTPSARLALRSLLFLFPTLEHTASRSIALQHLCRRVECLLRAEPRPFAPYAEFDRRDPLRLWVRGKKQRPGRNETSPRSAPFAKPTTALLYRPKPPPRPRQRPLGRPP